MKKSLFAGSFDPPTLGHVDIIKRAAKLCDVLFVGIATNTKKMHSEILHSKEKEKILKTLTAKINNVHVISFQGLASDFAKKHKIHFLIRGIRAFADFEYEYRMAAANKRLSGIETFFLMADIRHAHINSSLIREIAYFKGSLKHFVPPEVEKLLKKKMRT